MNSKKSKKNHHQLNEQGDCQPHRCSAASMGFLFVFMVTLIILTNAAMAEDVKFDYEVDQALIDTVTKGINVGGINGEGGVIKGVVKFEGRRAKQKPLSLEDDLYCVEYHASRQPPLNEKYVFNDNGTLRNVFVWVSAGVDAEMYAPPLDPVQLRQIGCIFYPHVCGVMIDQPLAIHNDDETVHNVKTKFFNITQNTRGIVDIKFFRKEEHALKFSCDVHPWEISYVHVMPHPFFAVTQEDGSFEIRGLPAGEYEVKVWHEFKYFKPTVPAITVTIGENETQEIEFTIKPPEKKKDK